MSDDKLCEYGKLSKESAIYMSDYAKGYIQGFVDWCGDKRNKTVENNRGRPGLMIGYSHAKHGLDPWWRRCPDRSNRNFIDLVDLVGGTCVAAEIVGVSDRTMRRWKSTGYDTDLPDLDVFEKIWERYFLLRGDG